MAWDRGNVCRTCLGPNKLRPIFHELEHHEKYTRVLLAATGQQINFNDDFPQHICSSCITTINNIVKYQKKCEQTNQQLVKQLETNKKLNSTKILETNKKHKIETITTEQILNFYANSSKIHSDDENDGSDSFNKQNDNCQSVTDIENDNCQSVINMQDDTCQDVDCHSVIDIQERECKYFTDIDDDCQSTTDVTETKHNDNCQPVMEMEHVKEFNSKIILKNNEKHEKGTITTEQILNFYANSSKIHSDDENDGSDSFNKQNDNCQSVTDIENDNCQSVINMQDDTCQDVDCHSVMDIQERECKYFTDIDDDCQSTTDVTETKHNDNCQPVMEMEHVKELNSKRILKNNEKHEKETITTEQILNFYAKSSKEILPDASDSFIKRQYVIDIQNDTCQSVTDIGDNRQSITHVIEIKQNNCQPLMEREHVKDKQINHLKDKNNKNKTTDSKLQLLHEFDSDNDDNDDDDSYSTVLQADDLGLPKNKYEISDIEEFVPQKEQNQKPENIKIKTDESIRNVSKSFIEIYNEILSHSHRCKKITKRNTIDDHIDHDHTYNSKSDQKETENESIPNKKTADKTLTNREETDSSFKYTKSEEHTVSTDRQTDGHASKSNESFRYTDQRINESKIMHEILLRQKQNKINLINKMIGKRNLRKKIERKILTSKNKEGMKDSITNEEVNTIGKQRKKYSCDVCHKVYKTGAGFNRHMKRHTGGYDIVCEHCSFRCYNEQVLLMHCRSRHGYEKKDKCSYCDYTAANKELVTVHERLHTGERPYVCATCGNRFMRFSTYRNHLATHLEKTVKCDECPALFRSVTLMKQHKYKHRGPTHTYKCIICDGTFKIPSDVVRHLRAVHGASGAVAERQYERIRLRPELNPVYYHYYHQQQQQQRQQRLHNTHSTKS